MSSLSALVPRWRQAFEPLAQRLPDDTNQQQQQHQKLDLCLLDLAYAVGRKSQVQVGGHMGCILVEGDFRDSAADGGSPQEDVIRRTVRIAAAGTNSWLYREGRSDVHAEINALGWMLKNRRLPGGATMEAAVFPEQVVIEYQAIEVEAARRSLPSVTFEESSPQLSPRFNPGDVIPSGGPTNGCGSDRLHHPQLSVYITMPPCKNCFGALVAAGVTRIVTPTQWYEEGQLAVASRLNIELVCLPLSVQSPSPPLSEQESTSNARAEIDNTDEEINAIETEKRRRDERVRRLVLAECCFPEAPGSEKPDVGEIKRLRDERKEEARAQKRRREMRRNSAAS